jgi:hypothetical protein
VALSATIANLTRADGSGKKNEKKGRQKPSKGKVTGPGQGKGQAPAYPDWKLRAPKKGEKQTLVRDKRTYYWCPHHRDGKGIWAAHSPVDCHAAGATRPTTDAGDSKPKWDRTPPKLSVAKALHAVMEAEDDYSDDE